MKCLSIWFCTALLVAANALPMMIIPDNDVILFRDGNLRDDGLRDGLRDDGLRDDGLRGAGLRGHHQKHRDIVGGTVAHLRDDKLRSVILDDDDDDIILLRSSSHPHHHDSHHEKHRAVVLDDDVVVTGGGDMILFRDDGCPDGYRDGLRDDGRRDHDGGLHRSVILDNDNDVVLPGKNDVILTGNDDLVVLRDDIAPAEKHRSVILDNDMIVTGNDDIVVLRDDIAPTEKHRSVILDDDNDVVVAGNNDIVLTGNDDVVMFRDSHHPGSSSHQFNKNKFQAGYPLPHIDIVRLLRSLIDSGKIHVSAPAHLTKPSPPKGEKTRAGGLGIIVNDGKYPSFGLPPPPRLTPVYG